MARRKKWIALSIGVVVIGSLVAFALVGYRGVGTAGTPWAGAGNAVGLVYVAGPIVSGSSGTDLFGAVAGADSVISELRQAREDPATKAVVVRIDSPGGSAAASQEIAREVERLREAGKVVVTSMGDVAASGGYWIACSTQYIMANAATLTGSIGVITQIQNIEGLYGKLGLSVETFKSGPHKDMGSSTRPIAPEERQMFQQMVDDIFQQFIDQVATGRQSKLTRSQVVDLADGRVFTGRQALQAGLVDELGTLDDAIAKAAEMAGLTSWHVKTYRRVNALLEWLSGLGLRLPLGLLPTGVVPTGLTGVAPTGLTGAVPTGLLPAGFLPVGERLLSLPWDHVAAYLLPPSLP